MNGESVNFGTGKSAAIETGTTLIGGTSTAVEAIWSSVPDAELLSGQMAGFWAFRTYFHVSPFSLGVSQRQDVLHGGSDPLVPSHSVYHQVERFDIIWGGRGLL